MIFLDFIRTIKRTFTRFLSILLMVALGVAFYTGVRSSEPDMKMTADKLYDDTDFMDIRVAGTLGLTDEDLDILKNDPDVLAAEGAMQTEVITDRGDTKQVFKVFSLGENINKAVVSGGRLPEKSGECFIDDFYFKTTGMSLGDTLRFETDASSDDEIEDVLVTGSYTVVGYGNYPFFTTFDRGTSSIGDGSTDGYILIPFGDFKIADEEEGIVYHSAYLTLKGAKDLICYSDDYEDKVDAVIERLKTLEDERCKARYDHVIGKGQEKIDEAEEKINDAKAKIADGEKQLADAEKEYNEEVIKAEKEIEDAKKEVEDGWKEYNDGLAEVAKNKADVKKARKELLDAKDELDENTDKVASARSEYEEKKKEFEEGEAEYLSKKTELEEAEEAFFAGFAAMGLTDREQILAMVSADPELSATYAQIKAGKAELDSAGAQIEEGRVALKEGEKQVLDGEKQIEEAGKEWQDGWNQMIDGEYKIEKAERDLVKAKSDLEEAERKIEDGEKELAEGKEEYKTKTADARKDIEEGKAKVADGEAELEDGKKKLADIDYPEWYVLKRNDSVQSYIEFGQDAERIGAVGRVFPAIFFLVAALVSLTTMTRMVEEERTQVGTLKALGYFKNRIAAKYGMYAVGASLIGGIAGVAVGHILLPLVIIDAYKILYVALPDPIMPVNWTIAIASVVIAVLSTAVATYIACYAELKGAPAQLMRPAVPKQGKRVFLERITFIWKHFSFTWKSTTRNLFRYKKRLFMTVFGIGGCMALLMVGFGLRDSIKQIVDNQYRTIWTYDAYLSIDENKETAGVTIGYPEIEDSLRARVVSVDAKTNTTTKSINLMVPEKLDTLNRYVRLKDRVTGEKYELTDNGVIVSEKLAKMLGLKVGSSFDLSDGDNGYVKVKISAITENYLYHYVYMSKETYKTLYGKEPAFNQLMLELKDVSDTEKSALSEKMLTDERVLTYTDVETLENKVADMMHALDLVIWVLIISAGLLAFVVLYNLNNISIIERRRELATLKVLGFYDKEVAIYVYRENVVLTILGILLGVVLGLVLHQYVIRTCEIDMIMFGRRIKALSYLWSVLLTFFFALLVNAAMFYRLRSVDMVESLKSAE